MREALDSVIGFHWNCEILVHARKCVRPYQGTHGWYFVLLMSMGCACDILSYAGIVLLRRTREKLQEFWAGEMESVYSEYSVFGDWPYFRIVGLL